MRKLTTILLLLPLLAHADPPVGYGKTALFCNGTLQQSGALNITGGSCSSALGITTVNPTGTTGDPVQNSHGGTGQDSSAWTGYAKITAGVWSALSTIPAAGITNTACTLSGCVFSGANTFSGSQIGTYSIAGTPTLAASLSVGTDNTYSIGDATHRLANLYALAHNSGASQTTLTSSLAAGATPAMVFNASASGWANTVFQWEAQGTGAGHAMMTLERDGTNAFTRLMLHRTDTGAITGGLISYDLVNLYFQLGSTTIYYLMSQSTFQPWTGAPTLGVTGSPWGNIFTSGTLAKYNNETTDGNGVESVEKVGYQVASSGAGVQTTTVATFTPSVAGLYRVMVDGACTTADTVSAVLTYKNALNTTAQTMTALNNSACPANGTFSSAPYQIDAATSQAILVQLTLSSYATTKLNATITRLK